jgi:hypothetical protein
MKIDLNFHDAVTVDAAVGEVDRLIAHLSNINDINIELKIVTGHGKTRNAIQDYLDDLGIEWKYEGTNEGCMLVYLGEDDEQ